MSEFWKSNGTYFCSYCKLYITDNKASRKQHEEGLKHKGNVERYVKSLYKKGAQQKKDKAEEASVLAAINAAVGDTSQPPPQASTSRKPRPATSSDPYANYSNAASLGLVDSEYEASFAAAREARQSEGNVGAWEHVTVASTSLSTLDNNDPEAHWSAKEREERRPTSKSFQEKTLDTDELYDPAAISIKLKRPKSKLEDTQLSASMKDDEGDVESTTQKKGFRKISEISPSSMAKSEEGITPDSSQLQRPSPPDAPFTTTAEDVKPDIDAATAPPSMFKKRKGAASSGSAAQRRKL